METKVIKVVSEEEVQLRLLAVYLVGELGVLQAAASNSKATHYSVATLPHPPSIIQPVVFSAMHQLFHSSLLHLFQVAVYSQELLPKAQGASLEVVHLLQQLVGEASEEASIWAQVAVES